MRTVLSVEFDGTRVSLMEDASLSAMLVGRGSRNPDRMFSGIVFRSAAGRFTLPNGDPVPVADPYDAEAVVKFVVVPDASGYTEESFASLLESIKRSVPRRPRPSDFSQEIAAEVSPSPRGRDLMRMYSEKMVDPSLYGVVSIEGSTGGGVP